MFLLRDLVSPRTWLAMTSHLAGLFMGFAVILVITVGLSLGFSLLVVALLGLPILGVTLRLAEPRLPANRASPWRSVAAAGRTWPLPGARGESVRN